MPDASDSALKSRGKNKTPSSTPTTSKKCKGFKECIRNSALESLDSNDTLDREYDQKNRLQEAKTNLKQSLRNFRGLIVTAVGTHFNTTLLYY